LRRIGLPQGAEAQEILLIFKLSQLRGRPIRSNPKDVEMASFIGSNSRCTAIQEEDLVGARCFT
jgi:hypothetical protein